MVSRSTISLQTITLVFSCSLVWVFLNPSAQAGEPWVGQFVLSKNQNVLFKATPESVTATSGELMGQVSRVLRESADSAQVLTSSGAMGWVPKRDLVLAKSASDYFSERLNENKRDGWARLARAIVYCTYGDLELSMTDLEEAVSTNPDKATVLTWRAIVWGKKGQYDECLTDISRAIAINPNSGEAYLCRARVRFAMGDDEQGFADVALAIKVQPNSPNPYTCRALQYLQNKDQEKALVDFCTAIRLDPSAAGAFCNRANIFIDRGDYQKAISDLNQAIRLKPEEHSYLSNRGIAWMKSDDYDSAIEDFTAALAICPQNLTALGFRAEIWFKTKRDYGKALTDYSAFRLLRPNDPDINRSTAVILAACPDAKLRDGKKAVTLSRSACELTRWKSPEALEAYAASCAEVGDFEEAVKWQQQAIDLQKPVPETSSGRLKLYQNRRPFWLKD
jgi:tetratricopeptide (TPR) repeat protein